MGKKTPLENILRHRDRGWRVCILRGEQYWERHFLDRKWGGEKEALQAAVEYRNELLRMLPIRELKHCKRNRSGILGVSRDFKVNPSGKRYPFWIAQWREGGRHFSKKFYVSAYGEKEAKALAIRTREEAIERKRAAAKILLKKQLERVPKV